jgi:hypothetical protein
VEIGRGITSLIPRLARILDNPTVEKVNRGLTEIRVMLVVRDHADRCSILVQYRLQIPGLRRAP